VRFSAEVFAKPFYYGALRTFLVVTLEVPRHPHTLTAPKIGTDCRGPTLSRGTLKLLCVLPWVIPCILIDMVFASKHNKEHSTYLHTLQTFHDTHPVFITFIFRWVLITKNGMGKDPLEKATYA
jgi:hypothetical protein